MEEGPSHTFDVFRLERPPGDLWRGDARIALRARPLAVLRYLDTRLVDLWCTSCLLPLEILSESFIHDLGDRQMIEVCLASDGLDPALLDMEGSSLNAFQVQKPASYRHTRRIGHSWCQILHSNSVYQAMSSWWVGRTVVGSSASGRLRLGKMGVATDGIHSRCWYPPR